MVYQITVCEYDEMQNEICSRKAENAWILITVRAYIKWNIVTTYILTTFGFSRTYIVTTPLDLNFLCIVFTKILKFWSFWRKIWK